MNKANWRIIIYVSITVITVMSAFCVYRMKSEARFRSMHITPDNAENRNIALTLSSYLNAFNTGDLSKAYAMIADKQELSLARFEANGDPQKGTDPVLTRIHVVKIGKAAVADTVISMTNGRATKPRHHLIFAFPIIKQNGVWKLVQSPSNFGSQTAKTFKRLESMAQTYDQNHSFKLH